ncbi:MAG: hypothetical protein HY898_01280 [Deltaproteobacteria bacterium]|nr:hypothetical protein [Deltaproteobacteria bacterium]
MRLLTTGSCAIVVAAVSTCVSGCAAAPAPPPEPVPVIAVVAVAPSSLPKQTQEPAAPDPEVAGVPVLFGLSPGMTLDQIRERLGTESSTQDYDSAARMWEAASHDTRRELPFLLGFDTVVFFNDGQADPNRPVWHIYLRDGRLVQAKGAIYPEVTDERLKLSFGFPPSCFINRDPKGIRETFGADDAVWVDGQHRTFHYFLRRGVAAMEEADHIQVLDIFTPLSPQRAREVAQALTGR